MSELKDQNEAACGGSALTAELGADRDIVDRLRDSQPEGTEGGLLLNDAADEIERLRDELQLASDTARYACDGWNDALMHEGAHMAAKAIEARKAPNASGEPGLTK